jgi:hypothetical protein
MSRNDHDHDATRELKTEWLQWWDGVAAAAASVDTDDDSDNHNARQQRHVMVVGATNRPWDVDAAAWRRLPHRLYVGLPQEFQRRKMFVNWTKDLPAIDPSVVEYFASHTEGYTPSDLHHLLIWACQIGPVSRGDDDLTVDDIANAITHVPPSRFSFQYVSQLKHFVNSHHHQQQQQPTTTESTTAGGSPFYGSQLGNNNFVGPTWLGNDDLNGSGGGKFYQLNFPVEPCVVNAIDEWLWNAYLNNQDYGDGYWSDSDYTPGDFDSDDLDDDMGL